MSKKWKKEIESAVADAYPGTKIKWSGDNPTLVVPDELEAKAGEIIEYTTAIWRMYGGDVEFYLDRAVRTAG